MQTFERQKAEAWYSDTSKKLHDLYPSYMSALGVDDLDIRKFCALMHNHAEDCKLYKQRDVFKIIILAFSLGAYFPYDPRFREALEGSLDRTHIPADRRVILLSEFTEQWQKNVWKDELLPQFGRRLIQHLSYSPKAHSVENRQESIFDMFPPAFFDRYDLCAAFCNLNEQHCDHYELRHPILRLAYMGCAVVHGVQWFDDPLLKNLKFVFYNSTKFEDLHDGMVSFYEGFA